MEKIGIRNLLFGSILTFFSSFIISMQLAKPIQSRYSVKSLSSQSKAIIRNIEKIGAEKYEHNKVVEKELLPTISAKNRKTPLQIQQQAQLKNIQENLKKDELFIYEEGTISGETISIEKAKQCSTIKNMMRDLETEYPEITIAVPYDNETIKNFCLVLRSEYKKSPPNKNWKDAIEKFNDPESQIYKLISNFTPDQIANILLLSDHLGCNSCNAIELIQQSFKQTINNISFLCSKTINEYRFALSHMYNTGQQVFSGGWGPPISGDRIAKRLKRNFRYYAGYFTSHAINNRFEEELKKSTLTVGDYSNILKKFSADISSDYLNHSSVLNEFKNIWNHQRWIMVPDQKEGRKQNLEDILYLYKNMKPIILKWVSLFPDTLKPVLEETVTKQEYERITSNLREKSAKPTLYDAFMMLNDFRKAWHSILENAEKNDWFF